MSILKYFSDSGCPTGWVANGALCYYVVDGPGMTYSAAEQKCEALGGDLPIIKSTEQNNFILSLAEKMNASPWLGMQIKNNDQFYWEDCTQVAKTFCAWDTGEPNYLNNEKCAYMYVNAGSSQAGKWNNNPCNKLYRAICQKPM